MPADSPGVVITQHIPPVFSLAFANRLNQLCAMEEGCRWRRCTSWESSHRAQVCYQRPSVDVMFTSIAEICGPNAIGAILTGMGADGAQVLLRMKKTGATTFAQDEDSCVVFGMPRGAIHMEAVDQILPLSRIAAAILNEAKRCVGERLSV